MQVTNNAPTYDIAITIGHNVKGRPHHTRKTVLSIFEAVTGVEAYTAIRCAGMWRGQAEESTRVEVCNLSESDAMNLLACLPVLAAQLEQEEIMVSHRESATRFVSAVSGAVSATA